MCCKDEKGLLFCYFAVHSKPAASCFAAVEHDKAVAAIWLDVRTVPAAARPSIELRERKGGDIMNSICTYILYRIRTLCTGWQHEKLRICIPGRH